MVAEYSMLPCDTIFEIVDHELDFKKVLGKMKYIYIKSGVLHNILLLLSLALCYCTSFLNTYINTHSHTQTIFQLFSIFFFYLVLSLCLSLPLFLIHKHLFLFFSRVLTSTLASSSVQCSLHENENGGNIIICTMPTTRRAAAITRRQLPTMLSVSHFTYVEG